MVIYHAPRKRMGAPKQWAIRIGGGHSLWGDLRKNTVRFSKNAGNDGFSGYVAKVDGDPDSRRAMGQQGRTRDFVPSPSRSSAIVLPVAAPMIS